MNPNNQSSEPEPGAAAAAAPVADPKTEEGVVVEEKVELTTTQYNALLSKIDELESPEDPNDLDALASEGLQGQEPAQKPLDYDNMTNQELVAALKQDMEVNVSSPLRVAIETMGLRMEIAELVKQEDYKDFWEHQEAIGPIAKANPNLSLKQCYDLAVGGAPKIVKADELTSTREKVLRHLPDPTKVHSEKPGAPVSVTSEGDPKDLKGAAGKAFDEIFGDKK